MTVALASLLLMREPSEFVGFLDQVKDELEGPAQGIARQAVAADSANGLTLPQQRALFFGLRSWMERYVEEDNLPEWNPELPLEAAAPLCSTEPERVPWCEVYLALTFYGGRCSYCEQVRNKPDDLSA